MNKKKVIYWAVVALVVVGVICFLKYNPLYATFETIAALVVGVFGEGILKWIYDKWVKKNGTESQESSVKE